MKKFSTLEQQPKVAKVDTYALAVRKLIESLDVEVEGAAAPWQKDIKLVASEGFNEALTQLVNLRYNAEKKELLEKARKTAFTRDAKWADDELDALNESAS